MRERPYRFSSPLLGAADVPPERLPGARRDERPAVVAARPVVASRPAGGWQADAQAAAVRSVSARGLDTKMPVASADAAAAITQRGYARGVVWSRLPAPHQASFVAPLAHEPADLRARVGTRDNRDPFAIVLSWRAELGLPAIAATDSAALVAGAHAAGTLYDPHELAAPGDLLVFSHVTSDADVDLVGFTIARDARGVIEFMYAGGGILRRGFLDASRPTTRRDLDGAVVNTFLRHGKRMPPTGTRYLAGELLVHVVH